MKMGIKDLKLLVLSVPLSAEEFKFINSKRTNNVENEAVIE